MKIRHLKSELEPIKKNLKSKESEMAVIKTRIEKADEELYGGQITSAKELESVEKSIEGFRQQLGAAEEKILTIMETADDRERHIREMIAELEEKKERFKRLNNSYKETREKLSAALEKINVKKEKLVKKVPQETLDKYYRLCSGFKDKKGVALLQANICSGCNMSVSFEIIKKAKTQQGEVNCDNCGRLLIIK